MEVSITIGNIVFLIIQFYIFLRKEDARKKYVSLFVFTAFCEIFYNLGFLFKVGSYEVNLPYISTIVTFIWGIIISIKRIITIRGKYLIFFYISLIIGILWRLVSPSEVIGINHFVQIDSLATGSSMVRLELTGYSFLIFIRTILCSFSLTFFAAAYEKNDFIKIIRKYVPIFKFVIAFAVVEFISNNLIDPNLIRNIVVDIFGRSSGAYLTPSFRGVFYSICLTCWEPSLANYALFFSSSAIFWNMNYSKRKNEYIFILVAALMMLLSMALTGLVFIMTIIALMLFRKNVRDKVVKIFFIAIPTGLITAGFLLISSSEAKVYIISRLVTTGQSIIYMIENPQSLSIFSVFGGASETLRFFSMFNNLYVWTRSPFIGNGIGTASSCSGWISALANIGIIGIFFLLKIYKGLSNQMGLKDYRLASLLIGAVFTIQGGLVDILCNTYYFIWIVLVAGIISNYRIKKIDSVTPYVCIENELETV